MDAALVWLSLVVIAIGAAVAWFLVVRLPRGENDVSDEERRNETAWISAVIERHGGIAPESLVEEVLELHVAYLQENSLRGERGTGDGWPEEVPHVGGPLPGSEVPSGALPSPPGPPGSPGSPGSQRPPPDAPGAPAPYPPTSPGTRPPPGQAPRGR